MMKRISVALLVVVAIAAAATLIAAPLTEGKVLSVDAASVKISIEGPAPSWIKKSAPVKFKDGGVGKIVEISEEGVTPVVITVKTKKALDVKAGATISFEKGKSMAGC